MPIVSRIIAQSAEKGSWPEVMCATEEALESEKLYLSHRNLRKYERRVCTNLLPLNT